MPGDTRLEPLPGWDCHTHVFDGLPLPAAGHYEPPLRSLESLQTEGSALDVGHVVLVQPSVYGTDCQLLLENLRRSAGRHRGVVVIEDSVTDAELAAMHACGVRGVRFNLVSPVGNGSEVFPALAPRLAELGWHVQWYATPEQLDTIAGLHAGLRLTAVLDHLAGLTPTHARREALWGALERVADTGAWIKLSGWYRLGATAPYDVLDPLIERVATLFWPRCVWGSDWPHTKFLEPGIVAPPPAYRDTWAPVLRVLGTERATRVLRDFPRDLYR